MYLPIASSAPRSREIGDGHVVVLVNPAWTFHKGNIGALPDLYPPPGLGCIAAVLRRDGFLVNVIDMPIRRMKEDSDAELLEMISDLRPAIIGFTAVSMTYPTVVRQANLVRSKLPGVPIIVGGVHVTLASSEVVRDGCFDYSVAGEGEQAIADICAGLIVGRVDPAIAGVGYHHAVPPYCVPRVHVDLSNLPPTAYDLFDLKKYRRAFQRMAVLTARGCNARCVFCSSGYTMPRVNFVPVSRVLEELRYLVSDQRFRFINIFDSNFTYDRRRVHTICDSIIAENLNFQWRCFSKANGVDGPLFEKMRAAGCSHVLFGVESSHDRTLKLIRKGNTRADVVRAFSLARSAGLKRIAYSIVGLPGESRQDVLDNIEFLEGLAADFHVVSPISLMPGTPLFSKAGEYHMVMTEPDLSHGSRGEAVATNSILGSDEISELAEMALRRLNNGRENYAWHKEALQEPGNCPAIAMMTLVDPVTGA